MLKQPVVNKYDFGLIVVNNTVYRRDLIITPSGVFPNWWRIEGHRLQLSDIRSVLDDEFDVVVIGTGFYGYMKVDNEVLEVFRKRGVEVYVLDSRRAVGKYNELVMRGMRVLLLIHLTC